MRVIILGKFCAIFVVIAFSNLSNGQTTGGADFSLFESLDNGASNNASSAPSRNNLPERGSRNTQATPTFVLVGTTSIGDHRSVFLKHRDGDVISVLLSSSVNPIPGHELYSIVSHSPLRIDVRYPAAIPCTEFLELGVACDSDTNIASLNLTIANAVVIAQEEVSIVDEAGQNESENVTRNPFEAIRERSRAGNPDQPARFQPRRIDPADVPPGMRVVSTPFGDRLVQQ